MTIYILNAEVHSTQILCEMTFSLFSAVVDEISVAIRLQRVLCFCKQLLSVLNQGSGALLDHVDCRTFALREVAPVTRLGFVAPRVLHLSCLSVESDLVTVYSKVVGHSSLFYFGTINTSLPA